MRIDRPVRFLISIGAAALLLGAAPPAAAVIDEITFGCRPSASGPVFLHAGQTRTLRVKGFGVDLVQRVEDSGVQGVTVRIGQRKSGVGSFVELEVTVGRSIRHGDQGTIKLKYPLGEDSFPVKLVDLVTVRSMSVEDATSTSGRFFLDINRDYTFVVRGSNLAIWDVPRKIGSDKNIDVTVLSRTDTEARLKIRSSQRGAHTISGIGLWNEVCSDPIPEAASPLHVSFSDPSRPTPPPAPTATARPAGPTATPRSTATPRPTAVRNANLLPQRLLAERPLLRKINSLSSIMVPITFCGNLGNDEEGDRPVPSFDWGVSNATDVDVTTPFDIQLIDGTTNRPLVTQRLTQLGARQLRTFSNWPGRPATVRVVRVVARLLRDYDNSPGCYLAKPGATSVPLDPRPILIKVDTGNVVPEGDRENDNELPIN